MFTTPRFLVACTQRLPIEVQAKVTESQLLEEELTFNENTLIYSLKFSFLMNTLYLDRQVYFWENEPVK